MFGIRTPKKTHRRKQSSGQYYFVDRTPGVSELVRDEGDNVDVIELKGNGNSEEEFRPKPVNRNIVPGVSPVKKPQTDSSIPRTIEPNPLSRAIFRIFGGRAGKTNTKSAFNEEGAKKVDPKLFFANERTFLKWMNVSIWVAAISIGLSSIKTAPPLSLESMSVLIFSALAIIIVIYAMVQYGKRSLLILKRSPGPYEDRYGPIVIGSLFALSFTAQYCIFMATLSDRTR